MLLRAVLAGAVIALGAAAGPDVQAAPPRPNVLLVTIDTLRADRMSGYGYTRPTSPHLDRLMAAGARFTQARTVEPLTGPALCSMVTSRYPHEHGASRNGLRMRPELESLPLLLAGHGYRTAAVVANWTLKDKVTGLAEHFEHYEVLLKRKRWMGLVSGEAVADDVTAGALEWLEGHRDNGRGAPFFLWVHYVEPHAPYELQRGRLAALGLPDDKDLPPEDRYDTEVAEVDASAGELLRQVEALVGAGTTLVVFSADHGESLGEHNYWGHGRNLYEPTLHIPLSITWPGRIRPATIDEPALITDIAPTVAGLVGIEPPEAFGGYDWTAALVEGGRAPADRLTWYQAHKGVVLSGHDSDLARKSGLLEIAFIQANLKEILRLKNGKLWRFDLAEDPAEQVNLATPAAASAASEQLQGWMDVVNAGLSQLDRDIPEQPLDEESAERLRALGYAD